MKTFVEKYAEITELSCSTNTQPNNSRLVMEFTFPVLKQDLTFECAVSFCSLFLLFFLSIKSLLA